MHELPDHPFLISEIASLGISRRQLDALVAQDAVRRVLRGVYVRADLPDTVDVRARCAALLLADHVVLCDRSAAWVWGIDCFDHADHEFLPRLETVSMGGHDRVRRGEVYGGKRDLDRHDICEVGGVRLTTPLRTACDLACLRGRNAALAVLDAFSRVHGLTPIDYDRMLRDRFRGRRGVKQARELAPYAVPDAESHGESWTRMTIVDDGLPAPSTQVWVLLPEYGRVRLDMAYERLRIAIEYDGEEFHTSDADRRRDRLRREALRRAGWIVIVVTKADFTGETSQRWIMELRDAIADRTPPYRRTYSRGESWDRAR
jgi:restriction endonuclease-like protein